MTKNKGSSPDNTPTSHSSGGTNTIRDLLSQATDKLTGKSASPRLDAQLLLSHTLDKPRSWLFAHDTDTVSPQQEQDFHNLTAQRAQGLPMAYLTQSREFWSLPLKINPHSLIPRPETELLVEQTLQQLAGCANAQILDLGCGSGAITLALAHERPDWHITAIERSPGALALARENKQALAIKNARFIQSDWFTGLNRLQRFDAIVSNPPYIAQDDPHLTQEEIRYEPMEALVSGQDGLDAIRHIIAHSPEYLKPEGWLLLEHGYDQKNAVTKLLQENRYVNIQSWQDIARQDRVSGGQRRVNPSTTPF